MGFSLLRVSFLSLFNYSQKHYTSDISDHHYVWRFLPHTRQFSRTSPVAQSEESTCSVGATGDLGSSLGWEDPLKEGMVTHSKILAGRIPWTEKPCRLQSMGSQRVGTTGWLNMYVRRQFSGTPAGCPAIQRNSDTICLEIVSDPTGRGLSPTRLLPPPPQFHTLTHTHTHMHVL